VCDTRCQGFRACCRNPPSGSQTCGVRRQREPDGLSGFPATPLWLPAERRDGRNQTGNELCQWLRYAASQSGVAGWPDKPSASLCRRTPQKTVTGDFPPAARDPGCGTNVGRTHLDHSCHFVDILLKRAGLIPGITRNAFL